MKTSHSVKAMIKKEEADGVPSASSSVPWHRGEPELASMRSLKLYREAPSLRN